jgi:tetratricopeptide (TPR) repeat protein
MPVTMRTWHPTSNTLCAALCLLVCLAGTAVSAATIPAKKVSDDQVAEDSLLQGRIEESVLRLQSILAAHPNDTASHLLLCRAFYAEDLIDDAVHACEGALAQAPRNSQIQDWLGRAYGLRADRSGPIAGYQLAKKVKIAFEAAVDDDPHNGDAVDDLCDYYVNAPALLGGGTDKADALADRVIAMLPQNGNRTRALSAEKRKDYDVAEREFRAAVSVAMRPDAWVDLAAYYSRRHLYDKSEDAVRHALAADHTHGPAIVDAATILHEMHRQQPLAQQALRLYLNSNAKSDAAPAAKVHVLLSKMLAEVGDKSGAKIELEAALVLAPNYPPAKRAIRDL